MSENNGRHRADDVLVLALACGETVAAAAQKAGVSEATVYRRLNEADFVARLKAAKAELIARATALLTAAAVEAVRTLRRLQRAKAPPAVRLGAARAVLELGSKLRTEGDLTARVEAAERALGLRT